MSVPSLIAVTRTQGNNRALKDGSVKPHGFEFSFEEVPVLINAFRRMVRHLDYEVCEMALSTYLCAREHGKPFTAIPIFLVRAFHHGAIVVRRDSAIHAPSDLHGQRVGVNRGYTVTAGVWARSVLHDEYGVDLNRIRWVLSGDEHVAEYQPPGNVEPNSSGASLTELLLAGELAAVIGAEADDPRLTTLIENPQQAGLNALRTRGHYPINHLIVIRDDVLERYPQVAPAVFNAFGQAKQRYIDALHAGSLPEETPVDRIHRRVAEIIGDPLPYGVEPNRLMLENAIEHCLNQGIIKRRFAVDELFATGTHELIA